MSLWFSLTLPIVQLGRLRLRKQKQHVSKVTHKQQWDLITSWPSASPCPGLALKKEAYWLLFLAVFPFPLVLVPSHPGLLYVFPDLRGVSTHSAALISRKSAAPTQELGWETDLGSKDAMCTQPRTSPFPNGASVSPASSRGLKGVRCGRHFPLSAITKQTPGFRCDCSGLKLLSDCPGGNPELWGSLGAPKAAERATIRQSQRNPDTGERRLRKKESVKTHSSLPPSPFPTPPPARLSPS